MKYIVSVFVFFSLVPLALADDHTPPTGSAALPGGELPQGNNIQLDDVVITETAPPRNNSRPGISIPFPTNIPPRTNLPSGPFGGAGTLPGGQLPQGGNVQLDDVLITDTAPSRDDGGSGVNIPLADIPNRSGLPGEEGIDNNLTGATGTNGATNATGAQPQNGTGESNSPDPNASRSSDGSEAESAGSDEDSLMPADVRFDANFERMVFPTWYEEEVVILEGDSPEVKEEKQRWNDAMAARRVSGVGGARADNKTLIDWMPIAGDIILFLFGPTFFVIWLITGIRVVTEPDKPESMDNLKRTAPTLLLALVLCVTMYTIFKALHWFLLQ